MRSLLVLLAILVLTPPLAVLVIAAALLGVRDRAGSIYDWAPRFWSRALLRAAGVQVVVHGPDVMHRGAAVYATNHVSWFDVFALAATLPRYKFVAKKELAGIPLFAQAVKAAGMIFIDRANRSAAMVGYEVAAERIRSGASVVVCPEGSRGTTYSLRPFKKGPFVLAIASRAPIVPTVVYGAREVLAKGSFLVHSGVVHIHLHEPIPSVAMTYDDRDALEAQAWQVMASTLEREYGVRSLNVREVPRPARGASATPDVIAPQSP
jgi:1-acyl-sn-glycerol-3-phosphate acyltransferase